jgi:hypothetical protein
MSGGALHWERLSAVRTMVLVVFGIAALALAGFSVPGWAGRVIGLAVIGLGAFLIEYLSGDDQRVR